MCTVVAIKDRHPTYPLIVAANRDEFYARPSTPPRLVHTSPRAIAGTDLVKGGSWMGANERGFFVAVTNQRTNGGTDPSLASRGTIVLEALARRDLGEVDALFASLDAREYNPFNAIYGDASTLKVAYARKNAREVAVSELASGVWVLPNDRIGSPEFPKAARASELITPHVEAPWEVLTAELARTLGDHTKPPLESIAEPPPGARFDRSLLRELQALCIHTPAYGTRSATIIALRPGAVAHYLFAAGPPCSTPFVDVTDLLA